MSPISRGWLLVLIGGGFWAIKPSKRLIFFKHLGISISVTGSCLHHTLQSISSSRSAFYAIQSVGPRFGCLHPLTSRKLFFGFALSILIFGLEVIFPSRSELRMLERCQLSILKSILGLPSRTSSLGIHLLMGTYPIALVAARSHLLFLRCIIIMPDSSTAKAILLHRLFHPHPNSLVTR